MPAMLAYIIITLQPRGKYTAKVGQYFSTVEKTNLSPYLKSLQPLPLAPL